MAILAASDKPIYFPSVTAVGEALTGLLTRAQILAESALGCNRPLEYETYTEIVRISKQYQTGQLSRWPVFASPVPVVEVRVGNIKTAYGRAIGRTAWAAISPSSYQIDYETGNLTLFVTSGFGFSVGLYFATEAKVTYSSGFDFTTDSADIRLIKSTVGQLAQYLFFAEGGGNTVAGAGPVTRIDVDGEYSVSYGQSAYQGLSGGGDNYKATIGAILLPIKKFALRGFR